MEKQKDVRKDLIKKLTASVQTRYSQLTEKDIRELVFEDKWMPSLLIKIRTLMDSALREIVDIIISLNERYDTTLPEIENSVGSHRELVKGFLKEMGIVF